MGLHRAAGQVEGRRDLRVGTALGRQAGYAAFAVRQGGRTRAGSAGATGAALVEEVLRHAAQPHRAEPLRVFHRLVQHLPRLGALPEGEQQPAVRDQRGDQLGPARRPPQQSDRPRREPQAPPPPVASPSIRSARPRTRAVPPTPRRAVSPPPPAPAPRAACPARAGTRRRPPATATARTGAPRGTPGAARTPGSPPAPRPAARRPPAVPPARTGSGGCARSPGRSAGRSRPPAGRPPPAGPSPPARSRPGCARWWGRVRTTGSPRRGRAVRPGRRRSRRGPPRRPPACR